MSFLFGDTSADWRPSKPRALTGIASARLGAAPSHAGLLSFQTLSLRCRSAADAHDGDSRTHYHLFTHLDFSIAWNGPHIIEVNVSAGARPQCERLLRRLGPAPRMPILPAASRSAFRWALRHT